VNKWAAFAKKEFSGALAKPEDFKNYRVGVLQGDAKERYLKDLAVTFRVPMADDASIPEKLTLNGREPEKVDIWITGLATGMHILSKKNIKDVVPVWIFEKTDNYLACNSSVPAAQIARLQTALDTMKKDGSYERIVGSYEGGGKTR